MQAVNMMKHFLQESTDTMVDTHAAFADHGKAMTEALHEATKTVETEIAWLETACLSDEVGLTATWVQIDSAIGTASALFPSDTGWRLQLAEPPAKPDASPAADQKGTTTKLSREHYSRVCDPHFIEMCTMHNAAANLVEKSTPSTRTTGLLAMIELGVRALNALMTATNPTGEAGDSYCCSNDTVSSNRDIEGWLALSIQDSPTIGLAALDDDAANAHKARICDSLSIRQAVSSLCEYALAAAKNKPDWEANTSLLRHWKKMVAESERDAARRAAQKTAWAKPTTGSDGTGSGSGEGNNVSGREDGRDSNSGSNGDGDGDGGNAGDGGSGSAESGSGAGGGGGGGSGGRGGGGNKNGSSDNIGGDGDGGGGGDGGNKNGSGSKSNSDGKSGSNKNGKRGGKSGKSGKGGNGSKGGSGTKGSSGRSGGGGAGGNKHPDGASADSGTGGGGGDRGDNKGDGSGDSTDKSKSGKRTGATAAPSITADAANVPDRVTNGPETPPRKPKAVPKQSDSPREQMLISPVAGEAARKATASETDADKTPKTTGPRKRRAEVSPVVTPENDGRQPLPDSQAADHDKSGNEMASSDDGGGIHYHIGPSEDATAYESATGTGTETSPRAAGTSMSDSSDATNALQISPRRTPVKRSRRANLVRPRSGITSDPETQERNALDGTDGNLAKAFASEREHNNTFKSQLIASLHTMKMTAETNQALTGPDGLLDTVVAQAFLLFEDTRERLVEPQSPVLPRFCQAVIAYAAQHKESMTTPGGSPIRMVSAELDDFHRFCLEHPSQHPLLPNIKVATQNLKAVEPLRQKKYLYDLLHQATVRVMSTPEWSSSGDSRYQYEHKDKVTRPRWPGQPADAPAGNRHAQANAICQHLAAKLSDTDLLQAAATDGQHLLMWRATNAATEICAEMQETVDAHKHVTPLILVECCRGAGSKVAARQTITYTGDDAYDAVEQTPDEQTATGVTHHMQAFWASLLAAHRDMELWRKKLLSALIRAGELPADGANAAHLAITLAEQAALVPIIPLRIRNRVENYQAGQLNLNRARKTGKEIARDMISYAAQLHWKAGSEDAEAICQAGGKLGQTPELRAAMMDLRARALRSLLPQLLRVDHVMSHPSNSWMADDETGNRKVQYNYSDMRYTGMSRELDRANQLTWPSAPTPDKPDAPPAADEPSAEPAAAAATASMQTPRDAGDDSRERENGGAGDDTDGNADDGAGIGGGATAEDRSGTRTGLDGGDAFQILVTMLASATITLNVTGEDSIDLIKDEIARRTAIPSDQIRLIHAGRQLHGPDSADDCGIGRASVVIMALRLRGGKNGDIYNVYGGPSGDGEGSDDDEHDGNNSSSNSRGGGGDNEGGGSADGGGGQRDDDGGNRDDSDRYDGGVSGARKSRGGHGDDGDGNADGGGKEPDDRSTKTIAGIWNPGSDDSGDEDGRKFNDDMNGEIDGNDSRDGDDGSYPFGGGNGGGYPPRYAGSLSCRSVEEEEEAAMYMHARHELAEAQAHTETDAPTSASDLLTWPRSGAEGPPSREAWNPRRARHGHGAPAGTWTATKTPPPDAGTNTRELTNAANTRRTWPEQRQYLTANHRMMSLDRERGIYADTMQAPPQAPEAEKRVVDRRADHNMRCKDDARAAMHAVSDNEYDVINAPVPGQVAQAALAGRQLDTSPVSTYRMHCPAANWQQQRPDDDARDHYFIPPPAAGRYTEPDAQTTAYGPGTVAPYASAGVQRRSRPLELDDDSRDERIRQHADGTWQCDLCKQTCGNCQALAYHRVFCSPRCHACRMMTARRRQKRKQCQDCRPRPSEQDPGCDHTLAQSREEVARITGVSINASGWNPKSRQSARPDSRYGDEHGTAPTASYQPKRQRRAPSSQAQPIRAEIEDRKYPTDDNQHAAGPAAATAARPMRRPPRQSDDRLPSSAAAAQHPPGSNDSFPLQVEAPGHSTHTFWVQCTSTVGALQAQVRAHNGLSRDPPLEACIRGRHVPLDPTRPLGTYELLGGPHGDTAPIRARTGCYGGSTFQIFAETLSGASITLNIAATHSVDLLTEEIAMRLKLPPDQLRLVHAGRQMAGNNTAADYGIQRAANVIVLLRLRGGGDSAASSRYRAAGGIKQRSGGHRTPPRGAQGPPTKDGGTESPPTSPTMAGGGGGGPDLALPAAVPPDSPRPARHTRCDVCVSSFVRLADATDVAVCPSCTGRDGALTPPRQQRAAGETAIASPVPHPASTTWLEVRASRQGVGLGVYVREAWYSGTYAPEYDHAHQPLMEYTGTYTPEADFPGDASREYAMSTHNHQTGTAGIIDASGQQNVTVTARYIQHAAARPLMGHGANVEFRETADGRVYVYAVKPLAAGQELLADYGSTYDYRARGFDRNAGASPATGQTQPPAQRTKRPHDAAELPYSLRPEPAGHYDARRSPGSDSSTSSDSGTSDRTLTSADGSPAAAASEDQDFQGVRRLADAVQRLAERYDEAPQTRPGQQRPPTPARPGSPPSTNDDALRQTRLDQHLPFVQHADRADKLAAAAARDQEEQAAARRAETAVIDTPPPEEPPAPAPSAQLALCPCGSPTCSDGWSCPDAVCKCQGGDIRNPHCEQRGWMRDREGCANESVGLTDILALLDLGRLQRVSTQCRTAARSTGRLRFFTRTGWSGTGQTSVQYSIFARQVQDEIRTERDAAALEVRLERLFAAVPFAAVPTAGGADPHAAPAMRHNEQRTTAAA
jgi:hypothetical protein